MKKQLTFYFIRHGRTHWNEQGLMQGHGDSPLTEQGILGAKKARIALQQINFNAAYSSCLKRTIDTAELIIGERDIPLFQHKGLNEQFFGKWEGQWVEPLREHPEFKQMINDPANYKAETNGGETYGQLAKRVMKALQDIIKIHNSGNILIVSHGHTLRLLIALLAGASWQNHREQGKSVSLLNTAISVVHYDSENGFRVEKVNDATHLE
ncbi:histidine phosphatase family protein [Rodentibacter myodis]|uniref:Histidine phosphatase family protein n=1 Tax=Rodentibacter myodis TaxID=1907939 RepID=A0A1V3JRS6_9PAST|nr:histidine phosphatase family protein [Rodentibacter myodis]OOF59379.1 histidine phosphatase family protein [Rodentibacter myodis]